MRDPLALRAGDADRDQAAQQLEEHHLAGRLDAAELEERVGKAYAATTLGDLAVLTADLPVLRRPVAAPVPGAPQSAGWVGLRRFSQVHDLSVPPEQAYAEALDLINGAMATFGYELVASDPARALVFARSERPRWVPLVCFFFFPIGLLALMARRTTRVRLAFLPQSGGRCRMRITGQARRPVRRAFLEISGA